MSLRKSLHVAQQEVGPTLNVLVERARGNAGRLGIAKSAEETFVIAGDCVLVLAIERIDSAVLERMVAHNRSQRACKVLFPGEIVIRAKARQAREAVASDGRVAIPRILKRKIDWNRRVCQREQ